MVSLRIQEEAAKPKLLQLLKPYGHKAILDGLISQHFSRHLHLHE
tara:strand:+ start:466 stop:600 length:135 start_codon:yes stop_codon:yes gene_type:complete